MACELAIDLAIVLDLARMRLITLLNHCHHFPGFVYEKAQLCPERGIIEIDVRPRRGSKPVCSGCHEPAAGYDHLGLRRFEFVPFWGFMVLLLYRMRRVDCRACGVRVEELPWAFGTSWEKVGQAVEYVVAWGLEHRHLGPIQAIGVDEIQYAKGHKYLTLVYQIEQGCIRLLWIGKDRTVESFEQFFNMIGKPLSDGIEFVCSDMWKPYLRVIRERCANAINILDRFHIVAKMNEALDDVRAAEARRLAQDGYQPVLKKTRWCVLKRKANLTSPQRFRLRDLLRYNLKTLRAHRELILNYFRARKQFSSGIVEGLNNKAKLTMRKAYGFRTFRITEIALYHALGKLPQPYATHTFY